MSGDMAELTLICIPSAYLKAFDLPDAGLSKCLGLPAIGRLTQIHWTERESYCLHNMDELCYAIFYSDKRLIAHCRTALHATATD